MGLVYLATTELKFYTHESMLCACESLVSHIMEEHRQRVFNDRLLRRYLGLRGIWQQEERGS